MNLGYSLIAIWVLGRFLAMYLFCSTFYLLSSRMTLLDEHSQTMTLSPIRCESTQDQRSIIKLRK